MIGRRLQHDRANQGALDLKKKCGLKEVCMTDTKEPIRTKDKASIGIPSISLYTIPLEMLIRDHFDSSRADSAA